MPISLSFKKIAMAFIAMSIAAAGYFTAAIPQASAVTALADIEPGDLIRGESYAAVYYMSVDGTRYVFPNFNTYYTWYGNDFSSVKFLSDADLFSIQIGGNVTYKPGTYMIKINTDPKTYAVEEGGVLRHVSSESVATSLYGSAWNTMIHDMPDGFFTNYTIGDAIVAGDDYDKTAIEASVSDIDDDKNRVAPEEISITDSGYSPIDVTVDAGQNVRFTNNGSEKHTATADDLSWGTGTLNAGDSFIATFDEEGTYTFFDGYDSGNTGAVYVD